MGSLQEMGPPELGAQLVSQPAEMHELSSGVQRGHEFHGSQGGRSPIQRLNPWTWRAWPRDRTKEKGRRKARTAQQDSTVKFEEYRSNSNSS